MALLQRRDPRPMFESIDAVHQAVHERGMYTVSKTFKAVANNAIVDFHIIPPAGYESHTRITIITEGKVYFVTYLNSTYTDEGTIHVPFNRATSGDASTAVVKFGTTPLVLGTQRGDDMINGGTGGNSSGGSLNQEIESIIAPTHDLLLRVQNVAGNAKDISFIINYYMRKIT